MIRSTIVAGVCLCLMSAAQAAAQSRTDWRAKTLADLQSAHAIIATQSPAAIDPANPAMQAWSRAGYDAALARAATVDSEAGWRYTLTAYVHGYGDPHLSFAADADPPEARQPGFVAAAVGETARVAWVDPNVESGVRVGDVITACDGQPIQHLLVDRVFPFQFFAALPEDRRRAVTRLFLDRANPFAPPPSACSFNGGEPRALAWLPVSETGHAAFWAAFRTAGWGAAAESGVTEPAPGIVWIGAPSFAPIGEKSGALGDSIKTVSEQAERYRSGRAIVVDLRGNTGGTSAMGENLFRAIWGEQALKQATALTESAAVDWRASPENARYVGRGSILLRLRFPNADIGDQWADVIAPGLKRAVRDGAPFYREGTANVGPSGGLTTRRPAGPSPFPARVILISNGSCASACLDFADLALAMPGTLLVGAHTSGDGLLMEVRSVQLDSGRGSLRIPIKVVRGRGRGAMETYAPDIAYTGEWTDEAVKAWVLQQIERGFDQTPAKP